MRDYCDAQAGFWLNSKFWSKFSRIPLSGIEDQNTPPYFGKLQIWVDQSLLQNIPPISENFRFGMTKVYSEIPPPISENFRFGMTKVYSGIPPTSPPHFRKLQIWDDQSLLWNTPPPHFRKLQIWDDQSLLWNTPPVSEDFRFGMTKVYSGIPPLPPPFQKTSDLG